MTDAFARFIESASTAIRDSKRAADVVLRIEPLLRALIQDRDWLDAKYVRPIERKPYAQYLLYRPDDFSYSVVSFVWNPGQGSPIHDHCTWGVIGQYEGEEEETRYKRTDSGSRADFASLEVSKTRACRPGDVSHVYAPDRDIHQIHNRALSPAVSIHVYGGDIGSQQRHTYSYPSGPILPFVSAYDLPGLPGVGPDQAK